jgi:hypothetical protein
VPDQTISQFTQVAYKSTLLIPVVDMEAPVGLKNVSITLNALSAEILEQVPEPAVAAIATETVPGLVAIGSGLTIDEAGLVELGDIGPAPYSAPGATTSRSVDEIFGDFINVKNYLAQASNDFGLALQLAAAQAASTGALGVLVPPGHYAAATTAVINVNGPFAIIGLMRSATVITVNHAGVAITVNQTDGAAQVDIAGFTMFATQAMTPAALKVQFPGAGESPSDAVLFKDVFLNITGSGSWAAGIMLVAGTTSPPATFGAIKIQNYSIIGSSAADPAPAGTYGISLSGVNDCSITGYWSTNCDAAIWIETYCEGIRVDQFSAVSVNWFMNMASDIVLGPGSPGGTVSVQKCWFNNFEIACYAGGWNVYSIPNSFIGRGEVVRIATSATPEWFAAKLLDCFGWQFDDSFYIDGLVGIAASHGIYATASGAAGQFSGGHSGAISSNRLTDAVYLGAGVQYCRFLDCLSFQAALPPGPPSNNYVDDSGNGTNLMTWLNDVGARSTSNPSWSFCTTNNVSMFEVASNDLFDSVFLAQPGILNAPATMKAFSASDIANNVSFLIESGGVGYVGFQNSAGLLGLFQSFPGQETVVNYPLLTAAATNNAVQIGANGADTNISVVIAAKGTSPVEINSPLALVGVFGSAGIQQAAVTTSTPSVTIDGGIDTLVINPATGATTVELQLPGAQVIGQVLHVLSSAAIALTYSSSPVGAPSSVAPNTPFTLKSVGGVWMRLA